MVVEGAVEVGAAAAVAVVVDRGRCVVSMLISWLKSSVCCTMASRVGWVCEEDELLGEDEAGAGAEVEPGLRNEAFVAAGGRGTGGWEGGEWPTLPLAESLLLLLPMGETDEEAGSMAVSVAAV